MQAGIGFHNDFGLIFAFKILDSLMFIIQQQAGDRRMGSDHHSMFGHIPADPTNFAKDIVGNGRWRFGLPRPSQ